MTIAWEFIFFKCKVSQDRSNKISLRLFGPIFILQNHEHISITKHSFLTSLYCSSSLSCFLSSGRASKRMAQERDWGSKGHGRGDRPPWCSCSVLLLPHGAYARFSFAMVLILGSPLPLVLKSPEKKGDGVGKIARPHGILQVVDEQHRSV